MLESKACHMLGRLGSAPRRRREGRGRLWRTAILAASVIAVSAILTITDSHACPRSEKSVEGSPATATLAPRAAPAAAPARAVARASFVQTASSTSSPSKTITRIGLANCCGDPSDHAGGTSCVAGTCSVCCAVARASDAPLILSDFSRGHALSMEFNSPMDVTAFLFRPPRPFS